MNLLIELVDERRSEGEFFLGWNSGIGKDLLEQAF